MPEENKPEDQNTSVSPSNNPPHSDIPPPLDIPAATFREQIRSDNPYLRDVVIKQESGKLGDL